MPFNHNLQNDDLATIQSIVSDLASRYSSVDNPDFLSNVTLHAQELPRPLRKFLNDFRLAEGNSDYAVVSGFVIEDTKIGPTPSHWDNRPAVSPTLEEEIYLMLMADLLGDAFAWATQQGGYICHDLLPVKGLETEQVGASSDCVLSWHTEDAFHSLRGDYLALMCLRNGEETATTIGSPDLSLLSNEEIEILFQPRFQIKPDHSHLPAFQGRKDLWQDKSLNKLENAYYKMSRALNSAPRIPLLHGCREAPFICIDPVYMDHPANDNSGSAALQALIESIDKNINDIVLKPGDVAFLDNNRVVHGRQPFKARYDGKDRWLKRVNITADLRKSYSVRSGDNGRMVF